MDRDVPDRGDAQPPLPRRYLLTTTGIAYLAGLCTGGWEVAHHGRPAVLTFALLLILLGMGLHGTLRAIARRV